MKNKKTTVLIIGIITILVVVIGLVVVGINVIGNKNNNSDISLGNKTYSGDVKLTAENKSDISKWNSSLFEVEDNRKNIIN